MATCVRGLLPGIAIRKSAFLQHMNTTAAQNNDNIGASSYLTRMKKGVRERGRGVRRSGSAEDNFHGAILG